jgi:hypothetical protein
MTDLRACQLPDRGLITVSGEERFDFLQRLVTANLDDLENQGSVYSCLLSPQGKFLHDFFVIYEDDQLMLECEGGARARDLHRRLRMYKLRSKVELDCREEIAVYALFGDVADAVMPRVYVDPRHREMGWRAFDKPENAQKIAFDDWDRQRIACTISDGSRDMTPEKANIIEMGLDNFGATALEKGCFVGQELIARMLHRGLAKKHLYTIQADTAEFPDNGADIKADGKLIGTMASSCGDLGLALLKDNAVDQLPAAGYALYNQAQASA